MSEIKVLIADDHPATREGFTNILQRQENITVIAIASDGLEAVRLAKKEKPTVALLDVAMPKLSGIEAAKQIREACPTTAILMVSAYNYKAYVVASMMAGARGYILKNASAEELTSAVHLVHSGNVVFNIDVFPKALDAALGHNIEDVKNVVQLHPRELEILRLVAKGKHNKQIAKEIFISERTVHTHLFNIFRKLDVGSRTEAVCCALREGLLTYSDILSDSANT